jgi:hypothetical protein
MCRLHRLRHANLQCENAERKYFAPSAAQIANRNTPTEEPVHATPLIAIYGSFGDGSS